MVLTTVMATFDIFSISATLKQCYRISRYMNIYVHRAEQNWLRVITPAEDKNQVIETIAKSAADMFVEHYLESAILATHSCFTPSGTFTVRNPDNDKSFYYEDLNEMFNRDDQIIRHNHSDSLPDDMTLIIRLSARPTVQLIDSAHGFVLWKFDPGVGCAEKCKLGYAGGILDVFPVNSHG